MCVNRQNAQREHPKFHLLYAVELHPVGRIFPQTEYLLLGETGGNLQGLPTNIQRSLYQQEKLTNNYYC